MPYLRCRKQRVEAVPFAGKEFAIVTASVLVVIGICIGFVGGLAYRAPRAHTYRAAPFRFSVAFPNYFAGIS